MTSGFFVARASESEFATTLDWENNVRENLFDLTLSSQNKAVASLFSKELVRFLSFSQSFKEDREIILVSKLFKLDPPFNLSHGPVEAH